MNKFGILTLGLAIGATAGFSAYFWSIQAHPGCAPIGEYLNPQLGCRGGQVIRKSSYDQLRGALAGYIAEQKSIGTAAEISVFFRDLADGPTMSIDASAVFAPASLLKMPLALAYLRMEEDTPGILDDRIRYTKAQQVAPQITPPTRSLALGEWYTVEQALEYMVTYSDNIAYAILSEYIQQLPQGNDYVFQAYQELGVIDPVNQTNQTITVHGYAGMFRQLYNASFVNKDLSEKVLGWLAASDFKGGIRQGVPSSVDVAHKFGERVLDDGDVQLHDCGVIYFTGNPYSLCIMTRGDDWNELSKIIGTISEQVYLEVNRRRI